MIGMRPTKLIGGGFSLFWGCQEGSKLRRFFVELFLIAAPDWTKLIGGRFLILCVHYAGYIQPTKTKNIFFGRVLDSCTPNDQNINL